MTHTTRQWRCDTHRYSPGPDDRDDRIEEREGEFFVLSEAGEDLDGPFQSREAAGERLRQIEAAKAARGDAIQRRRVQRWDVLELRLDESRVVHHDNGWIDVPGIATRTGVFEYVDASGDVKHELRSEAEVFAPESANTLKGVPFTNNHPNVPLDSTNTSTHQVGTVLDVARRDQLLEVMLRVTDQQTVEEIQRGKVELSGGYTTEVLEQAGEIDGVAFDAIQTQIRYNHLALVDQARAGPVARLHLDSGAAVQARSQTDMLKIKIAGKIHQLRHDDVGKLPSVALLAWATKQSPRTDQLETAEIEIDGTKLTLPKNVVGQIESLLTGEPAAAAQAGNGEVAADILEEEEEEPVDALEPGQRQTSTATPIPRGDGNATATLDMDALATRVADKLRTDAVAQVTRDVRARGELERRAAIVLDSGYRFDQSDDLTIMRDAILRMDEDAKSSVEAHKTDAAYLRGMFDRCMIEHERKGDSSLGVRSSLVVARGDGNVSKMDAAKKRYLDRIHGRTPEAAPAAGVTPPAPAAA